MTIQEAYEGMYDYFSRPGAVRAVHQDGDTCLYLTYEGNKCAVGCLIPTELYREEMDTEFWSIQEIRNALGWGNCVELEEFLIEAQNIHDHISVTAPHFITGLQDLAFRWNLTLRG